jgi:hypothetical protein
LEEIPYNLDTMADTEADATAVDAEETAAEETAAVDGAATETAAVDGAATVPPVTPAAMCLGQTVTSVSKTVTATPARGKTITTTQAKRKLFFPLITPDSYPNTKARDYLADLSDNEKRANEKNCNKDREDFLKEICPYNEKMTWGQAEKEYQTCMTALYNMKVSDVILLHPQITKGRRKVDINGSLRVFQQNMCAIFVFKTVFGPTSLPERMKPTLQHYEQNEYFLQSIMPLVKWWYNEFPEAITRTSVEEIMNKNIENFRRHIFTKVQTYGLWSEAFILQKVQSREVSPEMCRGVLLPHAMILDCLFKGFYEAMMRAQNLYCLEDEIAVNKWKENTKGRYF